MSNDRTQWKSPVSGDVMQIINLEGMEIHYDATSGGYWLERGELQQLAEHYGATVESIETGDFSQTRPGRISPESGEALVEFEFGEHSGIKLDIDPRSGGIWLDSGELDRVIAYLEAHPFGAAIPATDEPDDHIRLTDRVLLFLYALTQRPPLY